MESQLAGETEVLGENCPIASLFTTNPMRKFQCIFCIPKFVPRLNYTVSTARVHQLT
jgi:hypothetical protein